MKCLFKSTAHFLIRLFLYILEMGFIIIFFNSLIIKIDDQRVVKMMCLFIFYIELHELYSFGE